MELKVDFEKPQGFDEHWSAAVAKCVAQGIVEAAVKRIHKKSEENEEVVDGSEKPS
jgi:hypothetical protein